LTLSRTLLDLLEVNYRLDLVVCTYELDLLGLNDRDLRLTCDNMCDLLPPLL